MDLKVGSQLQAMQEGSARAYQKARQKVTEKEAIVAMRITVVWSIIIFVGFGLIALSQKFIQGTYFWIFFFTFVVTMLVLQYLSEKKYEKWQLRLRKCGWGLIALSLILLGLGVWVRIMPSRVFEEGLDGLPQWPLVIFGVYGAGSIWLLHYLRTGKNIRPRLKLRVAILGIPLIGAWSLSSAIFGFWLLWGSTPYQDQQEILDLKSIKTSVFKERREWKDEWQKTYPGARVVLALSGGGYRAAGIHAGVLRALDKLEIPIDYLTTVSGGSIVGSFYSLGYRPEHFQYLLASERPGLPNALFNIYALSGELFSVSEYRNSTTYSRHLSRAYFGDHNLSDTGGTRRPIPLINATEFESGKRWVFAPGDGEFEIACATHGQHSFGELAIADAVAASGAFPGVFEPVIADAISEHEFTDGGAVENIGLSGLRDYFHSVLPGDTRPNLVIISNASKEPSQRRVQAKWSITTMLVKAALAGSQAYERHLFADFTYDGYENWVEDLKNGGTEPVVFQSDQRRAFGVDTFGPARPVYTIVLDPTNEHILRDLTSGVVGEISYLISVENAPLKEIKLDKQDLESVPDIETLAELTESQVGATGWLGERIVEKYEDAIRRTLETIKN